MSARMLLGISVLVLVVAPAKSQVPRTAGLRLTEIYYNAAGDDSAEEWIEFANFGSAALDLKEFKLGDEEATGGGEGMVRFPEGSTIEPNQVVLVAQTASGFRARFGRLPDFELTDSDATVPDMVRYHAWASGDIALANDGDEIFILDGTDGVVDAVGYGASRFPMVPPVAGVLPGQSIERVPADCDSDSAVDWIPQRSPTPGELLVAGNCRSPAAVDAVDPMPIGRIQGSTAVSPYVNQMVTLRGVVTGFYEDRNSRGAVFYTMFVQDVVGAEDRDPLTSDGIAIFLGPQRPSLQLGDLVRVTGQVTEFFGLTELDNDGLTVSLEGEAVALPDPIPIDPPADNDLQSIYLEAFEGMRVALAGAALVVGPTHVGCGFAVVKQHDGLTRIQAAAASDPVGQVVTVLHPSDVDCSDLLAVKSGDTVTGIEGPLIFNFDRFKVVQQRVSSLDLSEAPMEDPDWPETVTGKLVTIASLNLNNYFDTSVDTGGEGEPALTLAELSLKRSKLAHQIGIGLACPTVLGVQEVENAPLLLDLAETLAGACHFTYEVSHLESVDARGIDVALLTDPRRVVVEQVQLRQGCTDIATGILDFAADCGPVRSPLFSRPPLQVDVRIENLDFTFIVNHFKSKRGGADVTAPRRMAQAEHIDALVTELLALDPLARIVVLGDFNDYELSPSQLRMTSAGGQLLNPMLAIPRSDRYSFIFDGISQLIDGILISPGLVSDVKEVAILHVNADYPYTLADDTDLASLPFRASDHDPLLLVLSATGKPAEDGGTDEAAAGSLIPTSAPDTSTYRESMDSDQAGRNQLQESTARTSIAALIGALIGILLLMGLGIVLFRRAP